MNRAFLALLVVFCFALKANAVEGLTGTKPNVIFILADDLGRGDLGCYGQTRIKTPNIDKLAAEGTRFTQVYCGTSVCAPCRASLMTGLHMGHSPIRANREIQPEGQMPLPPNTYTMGKLFKEAGYSTAVVGKWGLGMFDTPGSPLKVGFDHFFGYNCQRHAHSYFPTYLYNDDKRIELDGKTYAQDLIAQDTLDWVKANHQKPFFLYYAITLPHGKFEIDKVGEYEKENWPQVEKVYAAMVSRMDSDVGRLMALLKELKIDDKTLVMFSSDNGSAGGGANSHQAEFFDSNGEFRGIKRSMYEGGIRSPMIARWPGKVPAGKSHDGAWAFWDLMPTFAELVGGKIPVKVDGVSVVSALAGGEAPKREYFYWELHEGGSQQAVRFGDWKVVKTRVSAAPELYNIKEDPYEKKDLAKERPEEVKRGLALMAAARVEDPNWPMVEPAGRGRQGQQQNRRAGGAQ